MEILNNRKYKCYYIHQSVVKINIYITFLIIYVYLVRKYTHKKSAFLVVGPLRV